MKKSIITAACLLIAFTLVIQYARAGRKSNITVTIDTTSRYAYGALGAARNSSNTVEEIGCYTFGYSDNSSFASCYATNASNQSVSCTSTSPAIVAAAQSVNGDSHVYFAYDQGGACTFVHSQGASAPPTKAH
jgi:hypothetical protein